MRLLLLLSIFFFTSCNFNLDKKKDVIENDTSFADNIKQDIWVIPANKSYVEPYKDNQAGISHNQADSDNNNQVDVTNWISPDVNLCWYLSFTPGNYLINFEANVELNTVSEFLLSVSAVDSSDFHSEKRIKFKGINEFIVYPNLLSINIPQKGFYKVTFSPVSKTGLQFASVRNIIFKVDAANENSVRYANWLSSPSVYLTSNSPEEPDCNWLYSEILVPEGEDPVHTFYMGLGFFRGYFGIQVNSHTERRILFSVWDSSDEPVDRDLVKKEDRVTLVGKGDNVIAQGFNNQGTGGQSYNVYPWITGVPVELLLNVRQMKNNSILLSGWYKQKVSGNDKWQYIASWLAPNDKRYFNGFYSFIDNFHPLTGQSHRAAFFYNYCGLSVNDKKWMEFNNVKFSYTDGDNNSRADFGGGVKEINPERFYLWSGGYLKSDISDVFISKKTNMSPQINIDSLNAVIDNLVN